MTKEKLYPFSRIKHAHAIEFRLNRLINTDEQHELQLELIDLICDIVSSPDQKVAWLTGEQIALAKETVLWAEEQRG